MNYKNFISYIKKSFEEIMGPDVPINVHSILKNNDVRLDALTIVPEGQTLTPTIYLNGYYSQYQNGTPLNTIIREINDLYISSSNYISINTDKISKFSCARNSIAFKLINFNTNKELLDTIPYVKYLDLAVVFYIILDDDTSGNTTALITNEHLSAWKTDIDTIYELAFYNTPRILDTYFNSLEDLMKSFVINSLKTEMENLGEDEAENGVLPDETIELMAENIIGDYPKDRETKMYILTNQNRYNGAAVLLYDNVLQHASEKIGSDFYILPSSIHELILIPSKEDIDPSILLQMVCEVNETNVSITERLSNSVYYYNSEENKVTCLCTK